MKHRHEIESGRTSTATTHLMGFRSSGEAIAGRDQIRANKRKGDDEIARESHRVITLMDLAGHEKYLKTTYVQYTRIKMILRRIAWHCPTHMSYHCACSKHLQDSWCFVRVCRLRLDSSQQPSTTHTHDPTPSKSML
jgi:hypothetical protein